MRDGGAEVAEPLPSDFTQVTHTTGWVIFLLLGGSGVREEEGSKVSSSEEVEKSDVGDCFPRRLLRRMTNFVGPFRGFFGWGLLEEVGGAGADEAEPLAEGSSLADC